MKVHVFVLAACCLSQACDGASLRSSLLRHRQKSPMMMSAYPFYHTTTALHDELLQLSQNCPGMTMESIEGHNDDGQSRSIDVVTIKAPDSQPVNKNFMLFGEHSRELISPESGLHLVKSLCGQTSLSEKAKQVLVNNEFQIVVNGNPGSREKVEQGDFCLRVNPDGVDLNRNWDEKWQTDAVLDAGDTNPGPKPFSEPETRVFKDLVTKYEPTMFLTIHSGTKGMYMPWAFDMEHLASRNEPQMMEILKKLDKDHCECPFGAAGREVGYSCPGTCLDWVYDQLKTPYSFAFEIYTSPDNDEDLKARWQEKMTNGVGAFYQMNSHLGHAHFRDLFAEHPSGFVQLSMKQQKKHLGFGMSNEECFAQFNPGTEDEFNSVVDNWTDAYLDTATLVAQKLAAGSASADAGSASADAGSTSADV